jgi:hypothetical protein
VPDHDPLVRFQDPRSQHLQLGAGGRAVHPITWRAEYLTNGDPGLLPKKTGPKSHPNRTPAADVEKVLYLRQTYHLGPIRIVWYLARYHAIGISNACVYRILRRHGLNRLPAKMGRRAVHTKRYDKQVPGHHIQLDVKFLVFEGEGGAKIKRSQYTAIDDATRIRALKIYERHNQANAIDFVDYVIEKFPFRIQMIRTDRGHEFQAKFYWHVEDRGIRHTYIKPRSPQLNGKVERSHRSDQEEFYQLLDYNGDVDLGKSSPNGSASTISPDLMAPITARLLTKPSEIV